jgi:hypothetical protein
MQCPYWMNTARAMLGKFTDATEPLNLEALTPEELGKVWFQMKGLEKIFEDTLDGLKKIAARSPLPVGDTKEVRPSMRSRSYFDDSKARGLIVMLMGQAGATEQEIEAKLASLMGKTEYEEYRTVNRPGAEKPKRKRQLKVA